MAMKIRLARGGSKKRPHYRIVAADSRMPRDGRYIERLGTYDPLLPKDSEDRVKMNIERIQYWMGQGAEPTDRVSRFLEAAGIVEKKERANTLKAAPGKKARERAEQKAAKAAAAPVEEPAAETAQVEDEAVEHGPVEEAAVEKAPAEEAAKTGDAPVEEPAAEAAHVEDQAVEDTPVEEAPAEKAPIEEAAASGDAPAEEAAEEKAEG